MSVAHYLDRHAEPESALAERIDGRYRHAVVVPACDEDPGLVEGLLAAARETLAIVVVNGSVAHDEAVHRRNEAALDTLVDRARARPLGEGAWLGSIGPLDLLIVDRARPGRRFPKREGVGLARKIGCDVALALHARGRIASRFLHMTDADATLPSGHFEASEAQDAALLAYPFTHEPCGEAAVDEAHAVYEIYLRYYLLGLAWAGSPYAHHTIGSTLAVSAPAYAAARGVPPRQAGEDFYLVNKLCKLGPVIVPESAPIRLRARRSARVPFGTGRAVGVILGGRPLELYHPACFSLLGRWLAALNDLADGAIVDPLAQVADEPRLVAALSPLDPVPTLRRIVAAAPAARRRARVHEWFDAFRTLKLVHALRDGGLSSLPWRRALSLAPFVTGLDAGAEVFSLQAAMAVLEARGRRSGWDNLGACTGSPAHCL